MMDGRIYEGKGIGRGVLGDKVELWNLLEGVIAIINLICDTL